MKVKAKYVSVWDNGSDRIESSCIFNPETKEVTDIEVVAVDGMDLNYLDEEYIELENGEIIKNFTRDDGVEVVDGIAD